MGKKETCMNFSENKKHCACDEKGCSRHGVCCECIAYHRSCGDLPMCLR
jgi:hypothetical protein